MDQSIFRRLWDAAKPLARARLKASDPELYAYFRKAAGITDPATLTASATPTPSKFLTWNGLIWDQLKPAQRASLKRENEALYGLMRGSE